MCLFGVMIKTMIYDSKLKLWLKPHAFSEKYLVKLDAQDVFEKAILYIQNLKTSEIQRYGMN